jgi:hypothetical protein
MTLVSGKEFNAMYPNTTFYKLFNENFNNPQFGFKYKDGLNNDIVPLNDDGTGGILFINKEDISCWIEPKYKYMCEITIPQNAEVATIDHYNVCKKFKTTSLIINITTKIKIDSFEEWSNDEFCLHAVSQNAYALRYIKKELKTLELHEFCVKNQFFAIFCIEEEFITPELCMMAVKHDWRALECIDCRYDRFLTQELCEEAVKQNGYAFFFVKDEFLTLEMCERALHYNPYDTELCEFATKRKLELQQKLQ